MKKAIIIGMILFSFIINSAFASASVYDDFSTGPLDTSKWTEFPYNDPNIDEHYVDTVEQVYHAAQPTVVGNRQTFLKMNRLMNTGETLEFDAILVNRIGNAHMWMWFDGQPENWTHITPCSTPSPGCAMIGYWNGEHDVGTALGKYHIKIVYDEGQASVTFTRPDNTTITDIMGLTSSPTHMFGVSTLTGHNGEIHFDYDNFEITTEQEPECNCTEIKEKVSNLEEEVEDLKDRVETLEDNQGNVPSHTHPISDITGLQIALNNINSMIRTIVCNLLPSGLLKAAKFDTTYCQ